MVTPDKKPQNKEPSLEYLEKRLKMFDQRLDNLDSTVTALVERVMSQPLIIDITCPNCGRHIQINIVGNKRLGVKE